MNSFQTLGDINLYAKRVFIRVDFNVPTKEVDGKIEVTDSARIKGAIETIKAVQAANGRIILASHLGRPKGKVDLRYSLEPVAQKLSELLDHDVLFSPDSVGDGPESLSHQLRPGQILLLENLRFNSGEEKNDKEFSKKLAKLCDVYVSDAFGTLHRAHASTQGLPTLVPKRAIGKLIERELNYLKPLKEAPKRPVVLIMGGAKVSDKIGVLTHLLPKVDKVLIGGAMAYAFLRAKDHDIGKSMCPAEQIPVAKELLDLARVRNIELLLPADHIVTEKFDSTVGKVCDSVDIEPGWMGVDIGPRTLKRYEAALENAETIFWNGPMGVFENPEFSKGTYELAKAIAQCPGQKLVGGGDSAAAVTKSGMESQFDFISTGGGATLEYLEGKELPGLAILSLSRAERSNEDALNRMQSEADEAEIAYRANKAAEAEAEAKEKAEAREAFDAQAQERRERRLSALAKKEEEEAAKKAARIKFDEEAQLRRDARAKAKLELEASPKGNKNES